MKKIRADQLIAERGLAESREKARRLIMAGEVFFEGVGGRETVDKPGKLLPCDCPIAVREQAPFVSRGGEKLATALEYFQINIQGLHALDVGSSTGGFVDCLLKAGAAKVYAVDVGKGLLDQRLRIDPRVEVLEGVNFRRARPDLLGPGVLVDLVVVDVSFISLKLILPVCLQFIKPEAKLIALVKPQFELGPGMTDKGVVRNLDLQEEAVAGISALAQNQLGLGVLGCVPSRIRGAKGNQEYLLYMRKY